MNEIILYKSTDGAIKVDVLFENETVWLTQSQMAELFGKGRTTITEHIKNIFTEGELEQAMVCRDFRRTTQHGAIDGKTQTVTTKYYNLDVIISVGYRVKSEQEYEKYKNYQKEIEYVDSIKELDKDIKQLKLDVKQ